MMPGRGVLSTIARRFVYSRPDGDGASQSVGKPLQAKKEPGSATLRTLGHGAGAYRSRRARRQLACRHGSASCHTACFSGRRIEVLFRLDHKHAANAGRPVAADPLDLRAESEKKSPSAAGGMNSAVCARTGLNP